MKNMEEKKLIEILRSKRDGDKLANRLNDIKIKAMPLLNEIGKMFPEYTLHDISHSENVIENFELIVPVILGENLNIYEIYFLIASAYLHDIGMVNFPSMRDNAKDDNNEELAEQIRDGHHLRSEEYIVENYEGLMIDDPHQAEIIGRICRGHRKENLGDAILFDPNWIYKSYPINVALLASLLRISDELDITFIRAPLAVYEHVPPRNKISNEEWQKHLKVTGVAKHPEDPLLIKGSAICENPDIHRALKNLEIKINLELDDLINHLHHYREYKREIPRKFVLDIKEVNYKFYDFHFSLQEKEIISLLMGEKLYKSKEESIRELLKNSVDACRFKRDELRKRGMDYEPKIVFQILLEKWQLIVEDNGIGMDERIIESFFTKVGRSFYKSDQFLKDKHNFSPTSELGIGVLSYFMIANKITIDTKMDEMEPIQIEIDDISNFFLIKKSNKANSGTCIVLDLKKDLMDIRLRELVERYGTHIEFPIEVFNSEKHIIKDRVNFHSKFVLDEFDHVLGLETLRSKSDSDYFLGYFGFVVNNLDDNIFKVDPRYIVKTRKMESNCFISEEGILISDENINDLKPIWLRSQLLYFDINLKKGAIDLNAARNTIIKNNKLIILKRLVEEEIINSLENFFTSLERKKGCNFPYYIHYFFKNYIKSEFEFDYFTKISQIGLSDSFMKFLIKFCFFKCFSKDGLSLLNFEEIKEMNLPIVLMHNLNEKDDSYLIEIIKTLPEDLIYITDEDNTSFVYMAEQIFKQESISFEDIFSDPVRIPKEMYDLFMNVLENKSVLYDVRKMKSKSAKRFVEFADEATVIFNRDNKFIDLLIANQGFIEGNYFLLNEFFSALINTHNLKGLLTIQYKILKTFAKKGIIDRKDINIYAIKQTDLPPYFLDLEFRNLTY